MCVSLLLAIHVVEVGGVIDASVHVVEVGGVMLVYMWWRWVG